MAQGVTAGILQSLSAELAGVVEKIAPSVVRVDDGTRLTATGVVWSSEGVIVTTSHGVERDEELFIEFADTTRLAAAVVGRDDDTDLAALRVNASALTAIERAGSDEVKVGQLAVAVGRPGHAGLQATLGIVSSRFETQSHGQPEYILHTDALLAPGFSGGPLVDVSGRMVGLVNLMYGRMRGVALGTPTVENVVAALLSQGRVQRGYLGIRTQLVALPEHLKSTLTLEQGRGLLIAQVEANSPAESGGLLLGDVLLAIDGQPVTDVDELRRHLRIQHAGQAVTLRILRGGALHEFPITLGVEA